MSRDKRIETLAESHQKTARQLDLLAASLRDTLDRIKRLERQVLRRRPQRKKGGPPRGNAGRKPK